MALFSILKNGFITYRNAFIISLLGSAFLFTVILGLYLVIFPILVNSPIEEFSQMVLNDPEKWQKILQSTDFQVKFNLFILLINCILVPMSAGFYKVFSEEKPSYRTLFSFYNSIYTGRILGYVILLTAIKFFISLLTEAISVPSASISISVVISLLFTLTIPYIVLENQSLTQAMISSSRSITPRIFTALVVLFLAVMIAFLGVFFFLIGVVFTLPYFYSVNYWLYYSGKNIKM